MRRVLVTAAVFLLAGAVVNVAVAWGCAMWSGAVGPPRTGMQLPPDPLTLKGFGYTEITRITVLEPNPNLPFELAPVSYPYKRRDSVVRAGFPLRTYRCVITEEGHVRGGLDVRHMSIPWSSQYRRVLPLRPIWPGFIVNTLLYAVVFWLLICGPFVLPRFIRVKRGLCPKCGYPMGESAVCSECGKALPNSRSIIV